MVSCYSIMFGNVDHIRGAINDGRCLVGQIGGDAVGFCVSGLFYGFDFLELLVVAESWRRRGIGRALVEAWEDRAASPKVFTSTNQSNLPMQRLCESLGFVRSGIIENLDEG